MSALQLAVLAILDHAHAYPWSVQGFGLLRLYVRRIGRVHVWCDGLRYQGVSTIHNHSWDLESEIVFGRLTNTRLAESDAGDEYHKRRLVTGYNHEWTTNQDTVRLQIVSRDRYDPGDTYRQARHEIHRSEPLDGTVTVMARHEDDRGEANVYWPAGTAWGTAQPRPATPDDITTAIEAVARWIPREAGAAHGH